MVYFKGFSKYFLLLFSCLLLKNALNFKKFKNMRLTGKTNNFLQFSKVSFV